MPAANSRAMARRRPRRIIVDGRAARSDTSSSCLGRDAVPDAVPDQGGPVPAPNIVIEDAQVRAPEVDDLVEGVRREVRHGSAAPGGRTGRGPLLPVAT